jgi:cell division septum initiation protein DivIVA
MTTPDDRTLDPASIASVQFTTVRRGGLDASEVRGYLERLSGEVQALSAREAALRLELDQLKAQPSRGGELDEATVAAWLGEEAARVLTTARDAANQVKAKAEEQAGRLREESATEATRVREEAHAEVARLREDVAAEVARRQEESLAEAEAEIETARQEGRSMVSEARAVRERMLADLARRRDGARAQLTALRGERDRIVNAIEATRDHLDRLMDDLRAASPEDERDLPPVPYEQDLRAVTTGEPRLTLVRPLHPVHQDRESELAGVGDEGDPLGEPVFAHDDSELVAGSMSSSAVVLGEVDEAELGDAPDTASAVDVASLVELLESDAPSFTDESEVQELGAADEPAPVDELVAPSTPEDDEPDEPGPDQSGLDEGVPEDDVDRPSVDDLFARIRAARSDAVTPVEATTAEIPAVGEHRPESVEGSVEPAVAPAPTTETDEADKPLDPEAVLLRARDDAVAPLRATLARQLKRALADEQNEVFDRLRRVTKVEGPDDVLGTDADHAERYRASGEDAVWAAALAGAASTAPDLETPGALEGALEQHRVLDEVLDEVTLEVAMPLRERLEAALVGGGGDPEDVTGLLRNAYREWKAQRIDDLADELVLSAYGRGAFAAAPAGEPVRWVVDPSTPACRDEQVNAAAGPRPCGEEFPTGHRHPPAHAGCRCLLEATHG